MVVTLLYSGGAGNMPAYVMPEDGKASTMMWDAGLGGAGPSVYCSCGKEHYLPADEDYDYRDNFEYINLDGQLFMYDCESCSTKLAKYERFIWNNRDHIRSYLKIRIDQEKAWADQEHLINTLKGIT
jgi:hypothetical protein